MRHLPALLVLLVATIASACSGPVPVGSGGAPGTSSSASAGATASTMPTAASSPSSPAAGVSGAPSDGSPSAAAVPSATSGGTSDPAAGAAAVAAAGRLVEAAGASVSMAVERTKGEGQPETLISGRGVVDPSADRGRMEYDFTALFASPDHTPAPLERMALAWDADDLWGRPVGSDDAWETATRAEAAEMGGLVGRMPREVVGLVQLVADAEPATAERLPDGEIEGVVAERVLVPIPLEDAAGAGVPADTPTVEALRQTYGIDAIPLEVWLVEGDVRRVGYALARDEAPYGGPDRTTVTYDWTEIGDPIELTLPPPP